MTFILINRGLDFFNFKVCVFCEFVVKAFQPPTVLILEVSPVTIHFWISCVPHHFSQLKSYVTKHLS